MNKKIWIIEHIRDFWEEAKENKIKAEAKRKAIEEREKKNELAKKEKERQDI